jgi:UDP-N-acetylglucosamine acyltransferase
MIHQTAIIHPNVEIAENVVIGPYCIIKEGVKIGKGTILHSYVILEENTVLGEQNQLFHGVAIGGPPQDLSWKGEFSQVIIGNRNIIREYVTLHRATGGGATHVGDDNYLMAYMHAGHNVRIGSGCIIANGVQLGGYCQVEDRAVIGGLAAIHQFVRIGKMAMLGGLSRNVKDVPPFVLADGNPARIFGLNIVGLKRNGIPLERRQKLKKAYNLLFRSSLNLSQALKELEDNVEKTPEIEHLLYFLKNPSRQGILKRVARTKYNEGEDAQSFVLSNSSSATRL